MRTRLGLTVLTLGSSITSFIAYTLLLKKFGASARVDLLFYAASVPVSLAGIMSGVLLYLLPPRFTVLSYQLQEGTLSALAVCGASLAAIAISAATGYGLIYGRHLLIGLTIGFVFVALLTVIFTMNVCVAQARGVYIPTGIGSMVTSTGLLTGVLFAMYSGIEWFVLIGQIVGTSLAVWWLRRKLRVSNSICIQSDFQLAKIALGPLKAYAATITLGTMAFTLFQPIDSFLCTLLGSGAVSVMSYSQRVVVAVGTAVSLGAHAIAARTSRDSFLEGGYAALRRLANIEVVRVVGFGMLVWVGYMIVGHRILASMLGSTMLSTRDLARLLVVVQWMLLGVGPMAAIPYLFRIFYSIEHYRGPALMGMCIAPAYGILAWLMLARFDILALAYSYALVWWIALIAAVRWLNTIKVDKSQVLQK